MQDTLESVSTGVVAHANRVSDADAALDELDASFPHLYELVVLPYPGERSHVFAAEATEQDIPKLTGAIDMQHERPGRPRLVIVVGVAHHRSAASEIDTLRVALIDAPGQRAEADAMSRSLERNSINPAARADRVAVARLQIHADDPEAHAAANSREPKA